MGTNLQQLQPGQSATVTEVGGEGALRQHFLDMGIIPGEVVSLVKFAPMGDPMELMISGYTLTIRLDDAKNISVADVHATEKDEVENSETTDVNGMSANRKTTENSNTESNNSETKQGKKTKKSSSSNGKKGPKKESEHPRLGETATHRHEIREHKNRLVNKGKLTFALVGNQNCGKTTLFNQLTGSNQHVGNFPGVTVDRKSGSIKGYPNTEVIDLPGIYSLSPYTSEEIVSRRFILEEHPTAIINIIDATNIERNMYLTMQLLELGVPMVVALNMMDEMAGNGGTIHINEMERLLEVPVVAISAAKNRGIEELIDHAIHIAKYDEKPSRTDFCEKDDHGGAVHRAMHAVMSLIEDHAEAAGIPTRFAASKMIEGDSLVEEALKLDDQEKDILHKTVSQMEKERGLDRGAALADMRFRFIRKVCEQTVVKPRESREHIRSRNMDRFFTGRWTAIPAFIGIMFLIFWLTFDVIGGWLQGLLESGITALTGVVDEFLIEVDVAPALRSLVVDGIFTGVGTVISFVPIIVVLYFFLSMLEDSGYMARVAFVMDKLLQKLGLSGRSIVPMLIGFGCSVPAIMSTRTLPSDRDRRMTQLLIPFMSCSAKMPIYAFFAAAFFSGQAALVMIGMYVFGICISIIVALFLKKTVFRGEAVPFVMELPNYRLPGIKNVLLLVWDKAKDFLQRAFTVIFVGTILVWFMKTFNLSFHMVTDSGDSILAKLGGLIAPVFIPLGFGVWQMVTSLLSGFLAKESVVSMLIVLYGSVEGLRGALSPIDALSFLVFCLLYTPCIAAVASIRRESGAKAALIMVLFQCSVAWVVAFIVKWIGECFV